MFGQMNDRGYLFCEGDGHATLQAQLESARREINTLLEERILNTDPTALADYFFEKYKANVPALDRENLVAEQHERNVTVYDQFDRREFQVPGVAFDFELPFVGDSVIFKVQSNTFSSNPPRAEVRGSSLFFTISGRALDAEKVKQDVDSLIASIEQYLGWHQAMWGGFEAQLKQAIDQAIGDRRDRLLKQKGSAAALADLGIKLKEKPSDARTFVPPAVKQVITPKLPPMRPAQAPEPTLDKTQYETILGLIRDAGHSIEQSSSRTRELDEEALRDIFLVPLNAHFGSATGETFNFGGKTDILIKYEGQNLFVAEFKFWGGEKLYTETIDQLLSYLTWRDTKAAIIVFNRNLGFSSVVTKITEATSTHPKFVSGPKKLDETSSQFVFSLPNDPDRHVTVSVLCFDLGPKR